ncbi:hypothetical protein COCMIDRAFT_87080 [Bipolaris oryzae ATCC 44560]|uniref:Phosphatidate phosphatase APP1 catalytic domain-containing protein n=1 Tax=Bipolaris oryzae ATCC 44560 TaxID=930090 RepID=W6ZLV6_COCMI|nr:uncharacterized protein COCMIDRAFT_87080 [Bipolaris oryzae ATCC 44560]EUC48519.1 hypothetical protein COCMIDRAFT_87080 [Bipolaris oryzae ATCC 44560]
MINVFKEKWLNSPKEVHEDYSRRNIIVTGATSGIGKEAVFKFAKLGAAKVIIGARDLAKGESTRADLEARLGRKGQLEVWKLDMMSYDSVKAFADRANELKHLDIAVLNAGVWRVDYHQSQYGWEEDMQTNTLSTTLLAILLLPQLKLSKQYTGKIPVLEFVNSGLHQKAVVPPAVRQEPSVLDYYNKREHRKAQSQYSFSKAFLMYAATKLADEISSGDVIVTSVCPGWVQTDIGRDHFFPGIHILAFPFYFLFMRTPPIGANTVLSGTVQGEKVHGRFWKSDKIQPIPPCLQGPEMNELRMRVWKEIVAALQKDVPNVTRAIDMPNLPFRRKPSAHGRDSILRFLFPRTRARARIHLSKLRHETFPSLKHRAQSRIYRYLVYRQSLRLRGKPSIAQCLRGFTRRLAGSSYLEDAARARRQQIAKNPGEKTLVKPAMPYQESYEAREPGSRRRKLAGYLKAANELRQTYTQQYASNWSNREAQYDYEDDTPGGFPDAAVIRSGREEMVLFPSYARRHVKRKPEAQTSAIQEAGGQRSDAHESNNTGDADFWKEQWNNYEDDNAVVDVDVRGWIYSPHKGPMSRKQRLFIGLARQLVGVQAPAQTSGSSADSSRDTSPQGHDYRERAHMRDAQRDEAIAAREAEEILRRGESEARAAARGAYSERPAPQNDDIEIYRTESGNSMRPGNDRVQQLAHKTSQDSMRSEASIKPLQKRASWNQPSEMSPAELAEANARLMARLRHFLAIPMANTPISVFFYNETISKQRTVYTDAAGHFSISAALDFVPTHVRILASDRLSATEEVIVTSSQGISVISDIDDTIKHSAIGSGAREIFRNVFIRDLLDLTIDGVREWYNKMAEMGVKFHYVSNSPWQLYPVISKYFSLAGLPPGSFHLKQYSGMLQGIFEPVAERKKVTLDKIARDFPERNFILIGDSGEADLEVYTDFVLENSGRVVAVFIRDVTTTDGPGFFDPSMGPSSGNHSTSPPPAQAAGGDSSAASSKARSFSEEHDPELKAAIAASLRDMDAENDKRPRSIFPELDRDRRPKLAQRKPSSQRSAPNLIDLSSDDDADESPALRRFNSETRADNERHSSSVESNAMKSAPPPPKKPVALRSPASESAPFKPPPSGAKPPPPKPRVSSTAVNTSSPLAQQQDSPRSVNTSGPPKPPVGPKPTMTHQSQAPEDQQTYAGMARDKLWSVYNNLPALRSTEAPSSNTSTLEVSGVRKGPPPPPPRRGNRETAANAASYVGSKASSAWQHAPSMPYHARPQITSSQTSQPFSTATPRQGINRTSTGSTLAGPSGDQQQYGTKKEILWRQRWAHAEHVLGEQGVVLRSWRVGSDIMDEAVSIIQDAEKRPSSKGKPTDPKLREKVKEEVKQETNKDGGGKGEWSAWKASKLAKEYEKKGGGYENEAGSKNEPKKGVPQEKSPAKKKAEEKEKDDKKDEGSEEKEKEKESTRDEESKEDKEDAPPSTPKPKAKANTGAKKTGSAKKESKSVGAEKEDTKVLKGKGKGRTEGTRRSARVAGGKRKTYDDNDDGDQSEKEEAKKTAKPKAKKTKS